MTSHQLRPRNANFSLVAQLRPWLVSGLLIGGCSSQDWAMGLGSQAQEGEASIDPSHPSPDNTKLPSPDASDSATDPTSKDDEDNSPESEKSGSPSGPTPEEEQSSTSGGAPTTSNEDPGPDSSIPDPELDSSSQAPDADDSTQDPPLPTCGDGRVQADEECDDGNKIDTDACLSNCRRARCGDWIVWKGQEECDPGPDGDTLQYTTCAAVCGQFSEPILDASSPSRICYASESRACRAGPWDCRGCKDPDQ